MEMHTPTRIVCACVAGFALVAPLRAQSGRDCRSGRAAQAMTQGIRAFKNGEYAAAVDSFKAAVAADPVCTTAHLYLATAYMQQLIPGARRFAR
jgi:Tfp pilus assembly protein PilF